MRNHILNCEFVSQADKDAILKRQTEKELEKEAESTGFNDPLDFIGLEESALIIESASRGPSRRGSFTNPLQEQSHSLESPLLPPQSPLRRISFAAPDFVSPISPTLQSLALQRSTSFSHHPAAPLSPPFGLKKRKIEAPMSVLFLSLPFGLLNFVAFIDHFHNS